MKTFFASCAVLLCVTGLVRAAEPVHEFECDTPEGHSSYWSTTISSKKVTVAGTIDIKEKREHDRWNPVANVFLIAKGSRDALGLQIYTLKSQSGFLLLGLAKPNTDLEPPFAMLPGDTTTIQFSMSLAGNGTLTVMAADKSTSTSTKDFVAEKVQLSCSTGDFRFSNVKIH
jgi:hypothetical protein